MDMVSHYHALFFTILALVTSALIFLMVSKKKSKSNLPPGPPGWPVVGNLFQFARSNKPFFQYVDDLRAIYGPIFTLRMGSRTMVILSDPKLVHEALIEQGPLFATRPEENPTRAIFSSNKFTVNAAVYGPVWRSLRRNLVQNMLSTSRLKEFRHVRDKAMEKLIERFTSEAMENDGAVYVLKNTRFAAFVILLTMCFGLEMKEETVERMDEVMKKVLITLDPRIDDYLPILRPFFSKERKRAIEVRKEQVNFMVPLIEQRKQAVQNPGSDHSATTFSYLDTLFDLKVDGHMSGPTSDELVSLCSEFLNGGTDTTAAAVEWGMAQLIANPGVQAKLYEEIRSSVGDKRVDEKDVENMPYLHAVVKEVLRKHPPTYFSLTHAVTEPTKLAGYDITPDINVEIFHPAIGENPMLWSNPKKFDPDRYITGKEDADITGVTGVKMMPFGVGRRICPGLGLGTVHLHLMIARMVQEFEWSAFPANTNIDFTEKFAFTVVMKKSLRATIKQRA